MEFMHNYSIRKIGIGIIFVAFLMLMISGCQKEKSLSDQIMHIIDDKCNLSEICDISLNEITTFKWDKVVVFQVGSSSEEISNALGAKYEGSTDLMSGLIFVLDNKIVYEEMIPYQTERPTNLQIFIDKKANKLNNVVLSFDDAILKGSKEKLDNVSYYSISAKN
ncbi:hypothetical protein [Paenibacillus sp. P46E]|uniref:hypothetical protein n=1 Tax=Paenibacillus sp. P46E TaxID=1349436 RepID=UPI00093D19D1|nr:hypothetical protein [Paenibacillus sp. P46E]OKP94986.1 hypothetical protein A3849_28355 [Paenibacillus sp. P46E]